MGADQSRPRNSTQAPSSVRKTCYYELLGLDHQATEEGIRKAYRQKALELHPDRNLGDTENSTKKFAEVQTAYQILSDPQERAWYDSHRDAILGGDDGADGDTGAEFYNVRLTTTEELFALMGRFSSTVPLDDSPTGFFGMLSLTFSQLAVEEQAAREWEGLEPLQYPPFGAANDSYDMVAKPFYSAWSAFSTKKSFGWKDKFRLAEAPDRRVRRLMQRDNRSCRDEAIRDFNDAVRSLVAFTKKRDPRYQPSTQSEAERQRILRDSAAAQAARSRAANREKLGESGYVVPDWAKSGVRDQLSDFSSSQTESEVEHIECVVCSKVFKSEGQFEAHEKSRKHAKAVHQLRRQMKREDDSISLGSQGNMVGHLSPTDPEWPLGSGERPRAGTSAPRTHMGREDGATLQAPLLDTASHVSRSTSPSSDYATRDAVEARISSDNAAVEDTDPEGDPSPSLLSGMDNRHMGRPAAKKKTGKAKVKRERKAARQGEGDANRCTVCKEVFPSRSKLFEHIRTFHHDGLTTRTGRQKK